MQARIAALPDQIVANVKPAIVKQAEKLATAVREITPTAPEFERHPGELRESVHTEAGDVELGAKVVVDARDEKGAPYAAHVEYGHRTAKGAHVPAKPFFWPAYRHERRRIFAAIGRAITAAIKGYSPP